jgi:hypothetical protein
MKIRFNKMLQLGLALAMAGSFAACSGSSDSDDGGDGSADAASNNNDGSTDVTLFYITPGDSCYEIVSVASGSNDGCDFGVADTVANQGLVGASIPFNYDNTAYTIKVGTDGALGGGAIAFNMATLLRDGNTTDTAAPTCMWHEHVDATVTFTAQDQFNISASRTQSAFTAGCTNPPPPTGGTCTSTWTWTMKRNTKTPPECK